MKKLIYLLTTLSIGQLNAQGLFINVDGGYAMSAASQNIAANFNGGLTDQTNETVIGSFGKGVNFGGKAGYMFNPHVGAEIGFSYLAGAAFKNTYAKDLVYSGSVSTSGNMFRITPAIRISAGGDKKLKPYMSFGMVIGAAAKVTSKNTYSDLQSNQITETTWKYSGGASFGASASLGINFALSDKIGLFAELRAISQSWAAKKGEATAYTVNGADMLSAQTVSQKEVNYSNKYTVSSTSPASTGDPAVQLKSYRAFSSIGFNVGLSITLGKK